MIGTHKTRIDYRNQGTPEEEICVRYHNTDVVQIGPRWITLDNGGYLTPTTKRRMNQVSDHYGLGYKVFQKNYDWFVAIGNTVIPYGTGRRCTLNHNTMED